MTINPARIGATEASFRESHARLRSKFFPPPPPQPPPPPVLPASKPKRLFTAPIEIEDDLKKAKLDLANAEATDHAGSVDACVQIAVEVSSNRGVRIVDIVSKRRQQPLVEARHEVMYRCATETTLSLPKIGEIFRRDHTSVIYAIIAHASRTGAPLPRGMDAWQRSPKRGWR